MRERNIFLIVLGLFLAFYFMPIKEAWLNNALLSGFLMLHEYATLHILTCLVPALFIAGAIALFVKKQAVLKYLGNDAKPYISYPIAAVSGTILAVCSCTILPLFAGIYKRGAGLGPAIAFLYSGPAINVAAIFLTTSVLGPKIGVARAIASIIIAILVGVTMALIFREENSKEGLILKIDKEKQVSRKLLLPFFGAMVAILIVNGLQIDGLLKWFLIGILIFITGFIAFIKFDKATRIKWFEETWSTSKLLLPYLFVGVFVIGFVAPLIPEQLIVDLVGSNTIQANLIASIFGVFMYFSTLTEVPIMQALIAKGMAQGPALALLLTGPSLSLPAMLVIRQVLGNKKTIVYVIIIVIYSSIAGMLFGFV